MLMMKKKAQVPAYRVYVIGLKPEVLVSKKFREANPDYIAGKPCYYVGSTSHPPEVRAAKHRDAAAKKNGQKIYNSFAHSYYDGLRPSQYEKITAFSDRKSAEAAEEALALHLRKKGFAVWQK